MNAVRTADERLKWISMMTLLLMLLFFVAGAGVCFAVVSDRETGQAVSMTRSDFSAEKTDTTDTVTKFKEGELLVKFRKDVTEEVRRKVHARMQAEVIREFEKGDLHHIRLKSGITVEEAIDLYDADPDVEYAEPNYVVSVQNVPNDPQYSRLWGLAKTNAPSAWDTTTGSSNVVIAVLDSGIDYTHPDLSPNLWVNQTELHGTPGVDNDGNGYIDDIYGYNAIKHTGDPMDDFGHGTHVSGIIGAAGNNGIGVVGMNWNSRIMACKFIDASGNGYIADAIACLQYVRKMKDQGVNIVATNNSWGGSSYSQALYDSISAQQDILFIAAAGNNATENDHTPFYPASFTSPNVVAVAATDESDSLASFSNYGRRSVYLGAPGTDILSTMSARNAFGDSTGYAYLSGTSMATPHVSGLVGLLKAQNVNRSSSALRNLILTGGDTVAALTGKTLTGRRINAAESLNCTNKPLLSVLQFPAVPTVGAPQMVSVMSINCADPVGPVTAIISNGDSLILRDNGIAPDLIAGDGIFTGTWTPSSSFVTATITSSAGELIINAYAPPTISTATLPDGYAGAYYSQALSATGGKTPYTWSLVSGSSLPDGMTLSNGGIISGSPTVANSKTFNAQVKDAGNLSSTKSLTIIVQPSRPDLILSSVSGSSKGNRESKINVSATVKNQSQADAGSFTTTFYLSTDNSITSGDILLGAKTVTSLTGGSSITLGGSFTIPSGITAGTYYIGAMADSKGVIAETDETNNAKAGNTITIK